MLDIGEKEPVINMNRVKLSAHAKERFSQRLNVSDHNKASKMAKDIIVKGEYLGETYDKETGNKCFLYTYQGNMIVLDKNDFTIITVMQKDHGYFHDKLKNQFVSLAAKEIRKLNRQEQCLYRKLQEFKLEYNVQMAILEKRLYKTRSKNVVKYCKDKKDELNTYMFQLENNIKKVQTEKRKVQLSVSCII